MIPSLYQKILDASADVDRRHRDPAFWPADDFSIEYPVASWHTRYATVLAYLLRRMPLADVLMHVPDAGTRIWILDSGLQAVDFLQKELATRLSAPRDRIFWLTPRENETKEYLFLSKFIQEHDLQSIADVSAVIGVGGGIICNTAAFIAESLRTDLYFVTTTVMSMADVCGGKVRANLVSQGSEVKHYYKSFYEPNAIFADSRFLTSMPSVAVRSGIAELIKQGVFQSPSLLEYLMSSHFTPFDPRSDSLLRAVLWAADLKRICITLDPEEKPDGARIILRGGHDFSDRLEERLKFEIPHGFAVAIGIARQLEAAGEPKVSLALEAFRKFSLPTDEKIWRSALAA